MSSKIAVVTVSGKAYYRLVNELKKRRFDFLSLIPKEPIPPSIYVVITTEIEKSSINHPNILIYNPDIDPSITIEEALRIIQNKEAYEELVIGVDIGKTFGIAVLADGKILSKDEKNTLEIALSFVLQELTKNPANVKIVRIGNGVPKMAKEFANRLSIALPENGSIEMVSEENTSSLRNRGLIKKISDSESATRIAGKKGKLFSNSTNDF
jgi:hypothetical protein